MVQSERCYEAVNLSKAGKDLIRAAYACMLTKSVDTSVWDDELSQKWMSLFGVGND